MRMTFSGKKETCKKQTNKQNQARKRELYRIDLPLTKNIGIPIKKRKTLMPVYLDGKGVLFQYKQA